MKIGAIRDVSRTILGGDIITTKNLGGVTMAAIISIVSLLGIGLIRNLKKENPRSSPAKILRAPMAKVRIKMLDILSTKLVKKLAIIKSCHT
jgi:hypothetical protein